MFFWSQLTTFERFFFLSLNNKKKNLRTAAVVLAFFICWAPFHTQRLLYVAFYEYQWDFVSESVYQQVRGGAREGVEHPLEHAVAPAVEHAVVPRPPVEHAPPH